MKKVPLRLERVIDRYMTFLQEKQNLQLIIGRVHETAGRLERAAAAQSEKEIRIEEQVFKEEEKKLHWQIHELEISLHHYQHSLRSVRSMVSRSITVTVRGKSFQFRKRGENLEIMPRRTVERSP